MYLVPLAICISSELDILYLFSQCMQVLSVHGEAPFMHVWNIIPKSSLF